MPIWNCIHKKAKNVHVHVNIHVYIHGILRKLTQNWAHLCATISSMCTLRTLFSWHQQRTGAFIMTIMLVIFSQQANSSFDLFQCGTACTNPNVFRGAPTIYVDHYRRDIALARALIISAPSSSRLTCLVWEDCKALHTATIHICSDTANTQLHIITEATLITKA